MNLQRAIEIAVDAHKDDTDKGGNPYILHPLRLMMQMDTEEEKIVAVLHDVVEDHGDQWSVEKLRQEGFSGSVIRGLESVTKTTEEEQSAGDDVYFSFVRRAANDPIGRKVKFADIKDNLDITRIKNPGEDLSIRGSLNIYESVRESVPYFPLALSSFGITDRFWERSCAVRARREGQRSSSSGGIWMTRGTSW